MVVTHFLITTIINFTAVLAVLVATEAAVPVQASAHVAATVVPVVQEVKDIHEKALVVGILPMAIMALQVLPALPLVPWAISMWPRPSSICQPQEAKQAQTALVATPARVHYGMELTTGVLPAAAVAVPAALAAQPATSGQVVLVVAAAAAVPAVALIGKVVVIIITMLWAAQAALMQMGHQLPTVRRPR